MNDTPRTDKEIERISSQFDGDADNSEYAMDQMGRHARGLERELSSAKAEIAALKAEADPLAEMWRELEAYQPQADADGHGVSWKRMCEERTMEAAFNATTDAVGVGATDAADAASWVTPSVHLWGKAGAAKYTSDSAVRAIRFAKEMQT